MLSLLSFLLGLPAAVLNAVVAVVVVVVIVAIIVVVVVVTAVVVAVVVVVVVVAIKRTYRILFARNFSMMSILLLTAVSSIRKIVVKEDCILSRSILYAVFH